MSSGPEGEYPNQLLGTDPVTDTNVGTGNKFSAPMKLATAAGVGGIWLQSGAGVPAVGGNIGDLYIRSDPAGDSTYLYRCTVAGVAGVATWAAITGA